MEIRRFGVGHRRREGPAGTHGVDGQPIHSDEFGAIAELAFRPNAAVAPHSNPNLSYFIVIEGGGFVRVGDERARVAAGEAVVWPPDILHAAWTEQTPMRALVVEFATGPAGVVVTGPVAEAAPALIPAPVPAPVPAPISAQDGLIVEPGPAPPDRKSAEQEPW
jgi:quercetin dioxygenase-like cupin family protein